MLERYLTETVTKHFGHFVEGLDSDQVRLSAWKGEINLQNLKIRRNALDSLFRGRRTVKGDHASPVEIAYGRVGNLQVSVPWNVLRSQLTWKSRTNDSSSSSSASSSKSPVSIVLTDVSLLITPRRRESSPSLGDAQNLDAKDDNDSQDEDDECDDQSPAREEEIQEALDAELLKRVAESSADSRTDEGKKSWIQDRLATLLENLSVTVRNIHIRYEDNGHSMGFQWRTDASKAFAGIGLQGLPIPIHRYRPSFCVGITLKEFCIRATEPGAGGPQTETTGDSDKPAAPESKEGGDSESPAAGQKIRIASAEALAIYWDSDTPIMSEVAVQKTMTNGEFFESAFATLQSGPASRGWSPRSGFAPQHSFVLDPFSPSVTICLASNSSKDSSSGTPSTLTGNLPPCRFALSRNLLEDLGYLRKSYAAWQQSSAGHFSEATVRYLAGLRPTRSPLKDPRGWWLYVLEAIITVNREEALEAGVVEPRGERGRRRSGWLGVARLLAIRKTYLAAYESLLTSEINEAKYSAHQQLVKLEAMLDLPEVVAFRIHCYSWLRDNDIIKEAVVQETKSKGLGRWGWVGHSRGATRTEDDIKSVVVRASSSEELDALDQAAVVRIRSLYEMSQALDKEKANLSTKREEHDMEPQDLPYGLENSMNPLTWTADISCGEIGLQVNDRRAVHRHRDKQAAVVRLSCAFSQEQQIFRDGSWTYKLGIGSLRVKDSTRRKVRSKNFPYLIGPKRGHNFEGERVVVDDKEHDQIISLTISRSQHAFRSAALGSTTT